MIPYTPFISAPRVRSAKNDLPPVLARVTLVELCAAAKLPMRVSGGEKRAIVCIEGSEHFTVGRDYFVGVGDEWTATSSTAALRVLEVMAHGFHDYAARECVCQKKLFSAPKRHGRPPIGLRAKTARERMAAMRSRRAA